MSNYKNYTITTLSASVQEYDTSDALNIAQAPFIPSGRIRNSGYAYLAFSGEPPSENVFPFKAACYDGSWVRGKIGNYALKFDGVNDWVGVGSRGDWGWMNGAANTSAFKWSVSFWQKFDVLPSSTNTYSTVLSTNNFGGGNGVTIYHDDTSNANSMAMGITNAVGSAIFSLTGPTAYYPDDTEWHHIVVTYDQAAGSNNGKIYVDNVLKSQTNKQSTTVNDGIARRGLQIGAAAQGGAYPTPANLDEIAIWNVVLDATAVANLYNSGGGQPASNISLSNLVSYFRFEDGPGNDTTGNYPASISGSLGGGLQNMVPGGGKCRGG